MDSLFETVHEDAELLVINKPQDLVCHPTKGDVYSSLVSRVRLHLGERSEAHLINRLDRETSGVILVAKNLTAARAWRQAWESGGVRKTYTALVHGHLSADRGTVDAPLGKDDRSPVAIKDCVRPDGLAAVTEYRVDRRFWRGDAPFSRLTVYPRSGRKHQIRIHLASLGHPIVGDKLYGLDEQLYLALVESRLTPADWERLILPQQALHSRELQATVLGKEWSFVAPEPPMFAGFEQATSPLSARQPGAGRVE